MTISDMEENLDFYKYYGSAPIFQWVHDQESDVYGFSDFLKAIAPSSEITVQSGEDDNSWRLALEEGFSACFERYNDTMENEVKAAFNKFDADGSGAIDKDELAQLSKDLGYELNEEELNNALRDLDLNKDGVIDLYEFSRWYFTGMKPFNGSRRTMLRLGGGAKKLLETVADKARKAIIGQEMKVKNHSLTVGFNAPENPKTKVQINIFPGSKQHVKTLAYLKNTYEADK